MPSEKTNTAYDKWESHFRELESMIYHCGYDLSIDESADGLPMLSMVNGEQYMPVFDISTTTYNDNIVFDFTMSFPALSSTDMTYHDDIEYHVANWSNVAKIATYLTDFSIPMFNK